MKIHLNEGDFGTYLVVDEDGNSVLFQSDWDWPGLATSFGWRACAYCTYTDGTVDCDHYKASEMMQDAREFLDDNIGKVIEDPGYFEGE